MIDKKARVFPTAGHGVRGDIAEVAWLPATPSLSPAVNTQAVTTVFGPADELMIWGTT